MKRSSTLTGILLILSVSIYVGHVQNAVANEADWMPDANLRTAVRFALSLGNKGALTQAGMANLTSLTAKNAQISNLTGLEHATNLTQLDLRGNTISNISALSGLTNLESLKLKSNAISSVRALSGLTNLTLLNLKENNISSISGLSGLTNLEHLRVDENSITDVQPLTSLVNLSKLWIAGNSLTNAHLLSSLTGLTQIDIPIPDPPDTTAPSVSISVPSGTQNGAFSVTITFTETVSGFVQSEVSLSGSAASITAWSTNSDDTVYTATITPTASGTVTIGVAANVATDAANKQNTAATSQTVTVSVDTTAPGVSIAVPSGTQNSAFNATITFTEMVSGFVGSDVSLGGSAASITSWSANSDNTVYTATITPTASGTVTVGVAANVATDAAGNNNTAATSKNVTVSVDTNAPGVSIAVPSGVQNGAFNATITFTETVSGFVGSDVSLTGSSASITSWSANSDDTVYTATITPTASGTLTIGVAANVATDAANNQNTAATSKNVTVSVDTNAPGVSIAVPSGVQNGAFNATITFTETVSGFVGSDVSLSGSAASITSWTSNPWNDVEHTVSITPTASGTVTVGVAANVATDAAGNNNTAATSKNVTVSVDTNAPGVSIAVPSGVQNGAFNAIITFSETVSGFVGSDVSLTGSAASITGWSANSANTVYTATITPTTSGTVTIGVAANVATDAANNQNTAATSKNVTVSVDTTAPGVTVSVPSGTQNGAFNATITFTETVSGFVGSDVSLSGSAASITSWTSNPWNDVEHTVSITPTTSGQLTISVPAGVATDTAGNPNTASTPQTVSVDVDKPTVSIGVPSRTQTGAFDTTITFSETVSGFAQSDVSLAGSAASITSWSANSDDTVYTATITPTASGTVTVGVAANVATDAAGNNNTAATSKNVTVSVDTNAPGVSIAVPSGVQNGAFNATITFTETVSGFVGSDVSLTGSAASITGWSANSANTVYTATITPTTSGTVTIGVAADVATDAVNNQNTAATSKNVSVDVDKPAVNIGVPSGTQTGAFDTTLTFSETVSGFVGSDVSLTGSAASITSWNANSNNTVYTATITPTASGTVTIGVAANVATDAANNPNTAATSKNVTASVDTESPGVSIAVPSGVQTGAFNVTITFTEAVSGFVGSDVSLTGSAASITSWTSNPWNDVEHTVSITPTTSGQLTISVPAGVATDTAGNPNTASTPQTVTVDVDKPTVSIGVPSGTQTGAFDTTLTFSETVSGFVGSDVSLTGSAASITSWSANSDDTVYTATITPTASGTLTIGVAANVATDAANNQNTAATSKNVTVSVDTTAPGVTVSVPSGTQNGAFNATITFTETVSGFAQSDVSLTGSAASITSWSANSDNTVYTATITPTASGTVTIGVAANVAADDAGNNNTAATSKTVTVNIPALVPDPATWMPDANLRTAVRSALSLGNNDALTQAGMANLTSLTAKNAQISNLTGLEHATNLTRLDLRNNSISSITALSGLTELTKLLLAFNSITDAGPLSNLTELTFLSIRDNQIGSVTALGNLTKLKTLWIKNCGITDVSPLVTLSELETLRIAGNALTNAHLLGNLEDLNSVDIDIPDPPDTTAPGVSISVPSGTQTGAFDVTITFTKTVSGFVGSDVSLSGSASSITSWNANSANTAYTATITPTASGTVTIGVAANVATDAAGNNNTAATSKTVTASVDTESPGVSIAVPSGVLNGAFSVTITFTETVSGFVGSDVSLSGSAASITSWSANSDNTVYTATITPTASGIVTIGVAANVATDAAGNNNTAATSKNVIVIVDTTAPGVTVSVPSGTQNGAFNATITFSETVSGFAQSDVSLTGSAASITGWSANSNDTVYTATITPTASGTVTVSVAADVATDAANNPNTAATSQTVTISLPETTPDPATWMPDANLRAAVRSALGIASNANFSNADLSTLTSLRAVQVQVTNLTGLEYATGLTTLVAWGNRISSLTPIQNLTSLTDLRIGNNQISDVTPLDDLTSLTKLGMQHNNISDVTPLAGLVNLTWLRLAGNPISDLSPLVTLVNVTNSDVDLPEPDTTAPGVTVSVPSATQNGAFNATITFTETVSGFVGSEVSLSGSASSITSWSANSDNTVYTATITPTASGTVTVSVAASVATDAANNPNTAATPQTVNVDVGSPSVSITVPEEVQSGSFNVTILFNKPVSGFQGPPDISFAGSTATATINTVWISNPWNDVEHTVSITPTTSGQLTISVPAGVATDTAGNPNTASTPQTVTVDVDKPTVSIGVPSGTQTGAFDATITFSEAISGFVGSAVSLTGSAASITGWSANSDDTVYTATITPTASGTVTIGVAANVATDAANNQNAAATSKTVTVDVDKPTVSIGVPSGTQTGAFDTTLTFSETVSGFAQSDVSLTGSAASITGWSANSDDTVYTATITPTASGTVTIGVAANVAADAANNQNTAATSKNVTVSVDTTAPGVTVSVPSGTQNGAFNATITFTETVSGFVGSDVSLTGSAASITSWISNPWNDVEHTVSITPTTSGQLTISVPAGVATDTAGNPNTASTPQTVTVDVDKPTVSIGVPSGTQTGAFDTTLTFSETVSGFAQSDVSLTGSAASITSWSANSDNTVYTATITPTASGTVTIGVAANIATDAANNQNTAATSQTVTITLPESTPDPATWMPDANLRAAVRSALGIASNANFSTADLSTLTSLRAVQVQVTNLTGLEYATGLTTLVAWGNQISSLTPIQNLTSLTDLRIGNNQISDVTPLDDLTSLTKLGMQHNNISDVTPLAGLVNLTWLRLAGNPISDLSPLATLVKVTDSDVDLPEPDTTAPSVEITVPSDPQNGAFDATMTFSATVSGFVQADLTLSGTAAASITAWSTTDDITYTAEITPTLSGNVTLSIPAGVATDAANNPNTAATPQTVNVDVGSPSVSITVPEEVQSGSFNVTILFNKPVSGFQGPPDISFAGSTATATINTVWISNPWNDVEHTVSITPTTSGQLTISVPAGVATDTAGNPNTASTPQTVTVDVDKPTVSIGVPSGTQTGAFDATITFSEAISGFVGSAVSLTGSAASITGWSANSDDTVYTATITPTASGTVTIGVAANVATDAANNQNAAATSKTVTVDVDKPTVSIGVPSGTQTGAFDTTLTFSETVSGFAQSDVSLTGSAASITGWSANSDDTVYTATITPTASGAVTIGVAANVAADAANNANTAATSKTVTTLVVQPEQVDTTSPSVTLTLLSEVDNNRIDVQITFNEPVEGFGPTDLSITTNGLTQLDPKVTGGETIDPPPIVSITGWAPNPDKRTYTVYITTYTKTEGQVIINVPADVATDIDGNPNVAGNALSVDEEPEFYLFVYSLRPGSIWDQGDSSGGCHVSRPERLRDYLDINEDGSIDEDDVALVEAALGQFGDGITNSRTDINCDNIVDNKDLALVDDTEGPTFSISVPTDTQSSSAFDIGISFNEIVFDFDVNDISLAGSTATATVTNRGYGWSTSGTVRYSFKVTPTTSGDLVISVPAGAAKDALDNQNTASGTHTVTVDMGIPSVSITSTSVESGVLKVIITFSKAVSGFEQADLRVSGAGASITAWEAATDNTTFTATVTATTSGYVNCYVPAGVATDTDGRSNTASKLHSYRANLDPPSVEVSVPTEEQSGAFDVTITFSEQVWGFDQADVSLADSTAAATITDWTIKYAHSMHYRTTYEATITPTTSGTVVITIPADVATDQAYNGNTASNTHSITVSLPGSRLAPASLSGIVLDPTVLPTLDPEVLEAHLDILRAGSDGSLRYLQAIALIESILAEVRPEKTVLLANYPNPFNPETWIPYHLANDTDVQISIYDINGALVRQLDLGHQQAGYYTNRSRAAYWDGRNEFGERVATDIYFYQLQANNMSLLRKMVILK